MCFMVAECGSAVTMVAHELVFAIGDAADFIDGVNLLAALGGDAVQEECRLPVAAGSFDTVDRQPGLGDRGDRRWNSACWYRRILVDCAEYALIQLGIGK